MTAFFHFSERVEALAEAAERRCRGAFDRIEEIQAYNQQKILHAFQEQRIGGSHLTDTTGYGYDDRGRDALDQVFATAVGAEDALFRAGFASGTHAITVALFGVLRPGDVMLSVSGKPYDTLEEVIGLRGEGNGSLKDFGVEYRQLELREDGRFDLPAIAAACKGVKLCYIQRSRGYSLRPSFTVEEIAEVCRAAKEANPDCIVMVDNCYGEFSQKVEPVQVGADIMMGSLIKNAGGGIAQSGGYIAGRHDLVELCAYRLTSPGTGRELGCSLGQNRALYMGLFHAPTVTGEAMKVSCFANALFEELGYQVYPAVDDTRADIISAICLQDKERLCAFCRGIQAGAPVDSFVTPEPCPMPGYEDEVIMAAGAFTMGSSIELSADAPIREPFAVWFQGGLNYATGKIGILKAAEEVLKVNGQTA
ncbi:aminotransferase class I/II-fold pyridoxal phosphate-dependent enzyme [Bittarella sp. HCP28S3_D9]|uniref:methionine gamma-lyase family protein n=1 Tax=Bittarella sp. HCP28S3_D9 TaxID=3440253 RepID=UPI003F8A329A